MAYLWSIHLVSTENCPELKSVKIFTKFEMQQTALRFNKIRQGIFSYFLVVYCMWRRYSNKDNCSFATDAFRSKFFPDFANSRIIQTAMTVAYRGIIAKCCMKASYIDLIFQVLDAKWFDSIFGNHSCCYHYCNKLFVIRGSYMDIDT